MVSIVFEITIVTQLTTSAYNNSATPNTKPSDNATVGPPRFEVWRFTFHAADAEPSLGLGVLVAVYTPVNAAVVDELAPPVSWLESSDATLIGLPGIPARTLELGRVTDESSK
jgi:hypothetical protein